MLEAWNHTEITRPLGTENKLVMTDSSKASGYQDTDRIYLPRSTQFSTNTNSLKEAYWVPCMHVPVRVCTHVSMYMHL